MEDTCVVCMESLNSDHVHTIEECGHIFHSACIIGWLRRGNLTCPTCRQDVQQEHSIPSMALHDRAKHIIRTLGRRKHAPSELKRLIANLRKTKILEREFKQQNKNFRIQHRDVLKALNALRQKRWSLTRKIRSQERVIGLFQAPGLCLPPLTVYNSY